MIDKKVLIMNADDKLAEAIEEGLELSVYTPEICRLFLESLEKLNSNHYEFVFVYVANHADAYLISDTCRMTDTKVVAITQDNPGKITGDDNERLSDILYKRGAVLVVHRHNLAGEESYLPICLDTLCTEERRDGPREDP